MRQKRSRKTGIRSLDPSERTNEIESVCSSPRPRCLGWKLQVKILLNQFCMTYLFTKRESSLISSALKKSSFLKLMLLPNFAFNVIYTGNKKIVIKIIFRWCLNRDYSMILSWCYSKSSVHSYFTLIISNNQSYLPAVFETSINRFCF